MVEWLSHLSDWVVAGSSITPLLSRSCRWACVAPSMAVGRQRFVNRKADDRQRPRKRADRLGRFLTAKK